MSGLKYAGLFVIGATLLVSCGDSANPTKWSQMTKQVDAAVATPTPTPTPRPTPSPSPTPYVAPHWRQLKCEEEIPWLYKGTITKAQTQLREEKPQWFDYDSMPGWILVNKPQQYFQAMLDRLNEMEGGIYQANRHFYEPESHVAIKTNNEFSEVYQIITSFRGVSNAYAFTCRPAEF